MFCTTDVNKFMFYLLTKFNTISSKVSLVLISNQKINIDAHGYQYWLGYLLQRNSLKKLHIFLNSFTT